MTAAELALASAVAAPLLAAILAPFWRRGGWLLPLAPLPALAAGLALPQGSSLALPWLLLGSGLALDPVGRWLLPAAAGVWLGGGLLAAGPLAARPGLRALWLLTLTGNCWMLLADEPVGLFTAYALLGLSAFALVVADGGVRAARAGRVYIALVVLGEVLVFTALVAQAFAAAAAPGLLLLGFGVKLGLLPLHFGLPLAYGAAPAWAGVVLAGAMVNAGLAGWLRLLPLGEAALPAWGAAWIVLGLAAAFYGVAAGIGQDRPRTLLGYSSVSQMGLVTAATGAALVEPSLWPAALTGLLLFAVHHGLAKAALFAILHQLERSGSRLWAAALVLPALVLAGAPATSGMAAKLELKAVMEGLEGFPLWLLTLSSAATALLMARLIVVAWPRGRGSANAGLVPPLVALALVAVVIVLGLAVLPEEGLAGWVRAAWPVAAGLALGFLLQAARRWPQLPEGDVLIWIEQGLARLGYWRVPRATMAPVAQVMPSVRSWITAAEAGMREPINAGIALFALVLLLLLALSLP